MGPITLSMVALSSIGSPSFVDFARIGDGGPYSGSVPGIHGPTAFVGGGLGVEFVWAERGPQPRHTG